MWGWQDKKFDETKLCRILFYTCCYITLDLFNKQRADCFSECKLQSLNKKELLFNNWVLISMLK